MGEIATDHYKGRCCSECSMYFFDPFRNEIPEHGIEVLCWDCHEEMMRENISSSVPMSRSLYPLMGDEEQIKTYVDLMEHKNFREPGPQKKFRSKNTHLIPKKKKRK